MFYLVIFILNISSYATEQLAPIEVVEEVPSYLNISKDKKSLKLNREQIRNKRETSVGDILKSEAGIQTTSFGANSSRPVIRGLDGDRVKVLQNGMSTLDASTQSLDHAIPVNSLLLDQVEVLKGPMSLLYGPSAVGGVVNFANSRIRPELETGTISQLVTQAETAQNGLSSALQIDHGIGRWMLHVDGTTRNLADQNIPAHVKAGVEQDKNKVPNSFNKLNDLGFGATHILESGFFGLAYNQLDTLYGSVADEEVSINMKQKRGEFNWQWSSEHLAWLDKLILKSIQSDYRHEEIENGQVGTTFENKGNETRLELHSKSGKSKGIQGIQTQLNTFKAQGEEAFLPPTDNSKFAGFVTRSFEMSSIHSLTFGLRAENVRIKKQQSEKFGNVDTKDYLSLNSSFGHNYQLTKFSSLDSTIAYSERTPNFQELYALGDHLATASFEEGDSGLLKEKIYSFEISFLNQSSLSNLKFNLFTQVFKDYISLNPTGNTGNSPEGLDEYKYQQTDALFYGADAQSDNQIKESFGGVFRLVSKADWVRAKDTNSGKNIPRISPARIGLELNFKKDLWKSYVEWQHGFHQTKTAPQEKWTSSYNQINLGYEYQWLMKNSTLSFFAKVRNLFDAEIRNHVSLLKEISPAPGRNYVTGIEATF
jgi:iron complex outermembrane recepter protein